MSHESPPKMASPYGRDGLADQSWMDDPPGHATGSWNIARGEVMSGSDSKSFYKGSKVSKSLKWPCAGNLATQRVWAAQRKSLRTSTAGRRQTNQTWAPAPTSVADWIVTRLVGTTASTTASLALRCIFERFARFANVPLPDTSIWLGVGSKF